jgi:hypothetical protein
MTTTWLDSPRRTHGSLAPQVLRGIVVLSLGVDAVVHLRLAGGYQQSAPGGIGAGSLFRLEAAAAAAVAVWVLVRGSRAALIAAFSVGFSAAVAVVLYRYVDVPALGPIPAMYEPVWFLEKSLSAAAEAVAAVAASIALLIAPPRHPGIEPGRRPTPQVLDRMTNPVWSDDT